MFKKYLAIGLIVASIISGMIAGWGLNIIESQNIEFAKTSEAYLWYTESDSDSSWKIISNGGVFDVVEILATENKYENSLTVQQLNSQYSSGDVLHIIYLDKDSGNWIIGLSVDDDILLDPELSLARLNDNTYPIVWFVPIMIFLLVGIAVTSIYFGNLKSTIDDYECRNDEAIISAYTTMMYFGSKRGDRLTRVYQFDGYYVFTYIKGLKPVELYITKNDYEHYSTSGQWVDYTTDVTGKYLVKQTNTVDTKMIRESIQKIIDLCQDYLADSDLPDKQKGIINNVIMPEMETMYRLVEKDESPLINDDGTLSSVRFIDEIEGGEKSPLAYRIARLQKQAIRWKSSK